MLAYDYCYTGRITRRQILDKIPYLILTGAAILLTVHAQDKDTALIQSTMTLGRRAAVLAKIFALYFGKSILPIGLSAFYLVAGRPVEGYFLLFGALAAAGCLAGFWFWHRRLPAAAFGIALFLLPLGTVMNFILHTSCGWPTGISSSPPSGCRSSRSRSSDRGERPRKGARAAPGRAPHSESQRRR